MTKVLARPSISSFCPSTRKKLDNKENKNPNGRKGELAESYVNYIFKYLPVSYNSIINGVDGNSETEIDVSFRGLGHTMTTGLEVKFRNTAAKIAADFEKIILQNNKQNETHGGMSSVYIFGSANTKEHYVKKFQESTIELIEITRIEELLDKIADPALANVGKHFYIVKSEEDIKKDLLNLEKNYSAKQPCFDVLLRGLKAAYEQHIDEAKKNDTKNQFDTFLSVMVQLIKYMYGKDKSDEAENKIIELLSNHREFLQQFDCFKKFVESKQNNSIMKQIKDDWDHQVHKDQAEAKALSEQINELKSLINGIRTQTTQLNVKLPDDFPKEDTLTDDCDLSTIDFTIRSWMKKLVTSPGFNAFNYTNKLSDVWETAHIHLIEQENSREKDQLNQQKQLKMQSAADKEAADKAEAEAKAEAKAEAEAKAAEAKAAAAAEAAAKAEAAAEAKAKAEEIKAQAKAKPEAAEAKPKLSKSQKKAKAKAAADKAAAAAAKAKAAADKAAADKAAATDKAKAEAAAKAKAAKKSARLTQLLKSPDTKTLIKLPNCAEQPSIPPELQNKAQEIRNILISGEPTAESTAINTINQIRDHKDLNSILTAKFESGRTLLHEAFSKDYDQFVRECFDKLDDDSFAIKLISSGPRNCFHEAAIANAPKVTTFIFKKYHNDNHSNMYALFTQPDKEKSFTAWDYALENNSSKFISAICDSFTAEDTEELDYIFRGYAGDCASFRSYVNQKSNNPINEKDLIWVLLDKLKLQRVQALLNPPPIDPTILNFLNIGQTAVNTDALQSFKAIYAQYIERKYRRLGSDLVRL